MSFCLSVKGKFTFCVKQNRFSLSAFFSSSIAKKQAHFPWVYEKTRVLLYIPWQGKQNEYTQMKQALAKILSYHGFSLSVQIFQGENTNYV